VTARCRSRVRDLIDAIANIDERRLVGVLHTPHRARCCRCRPGAEYLIRFRAGHWGKQAAPDPEQPAASYKGARDSRTLEERASDTYFCNFSIFQSLPGQLGITRSFPQIMPCTANELTSRQSRLATAPATRTVRSTVRGSARRKRTLELHEPAGLERTTTWAPCSSAPTRKTSATAQSLGDTTWCTSSA